MSSRVPMSHLSSKFAKEDLTVKLHFMYYGCMHECKRCCFHKGEARKTDRQTERQKMDSKDRNKDRHIDRLTDSHLDIKHVKRKTDIQMSIKTETQIER